MMKNLLKILVAFVAGMVVAILMTAEEPDQKASVQHQEVVSQTDAVPFHE